MILHYIFHQVYNAYQALLNGLDVMLQVCHNLPMLPTESADRNANFTNVRQKNYFYGLLGTLLLLPTFALFPESFLPENDSNSCLFIGMYYLHGIFYVFVLSFRLLYVCFLIAWVLVGDRYTVQVRSSSIS